MTSDYEKYEAQRHARQLELNKELIEPISFEIYKKTPEERHNLKLMKREWKMDQRELHLENDLS